MLVRGTDLFRGSAQQVVYFNLQQNSVVFYPELNVMCLLYDQNMFRLIAAICMGDFGN